MSTFQEIVVEAQRNVKSMEPFLKGTTPSTAWVIMYKFWTLPLTIRQLENLIDHPHSVYLRGIGFLYLRYVCKPDQLWDWLGPYLEDDQDIVLQGGVKPVYSTIGKMCYMLLNDQKFLGQILPRIPVMVMRDLEKKLEPYADAGRAKSGQRDHFRKEKSDNRGKGRDRDRDDYKGPSRYDRDRSRSRDRSRDRGGRRGGGGRYDEDDYRSSRRRSYSRSRSRDRYRDRKDDYRRRSRSPSRR
ncbi:PRP38 pre-mRNA processing factor 38 domain-containing protein B [Haplosporangium sp. Z 767]|nr:PRP38 pre-mRNA processing factor 38 domain-containing protein B [Haplosporangium sp. Z 767]KAF9193229.1 PRP38 pre-mRNA processing factor 38 domain-containing protein B [Haplosporangium sp. Z 11]